MRTSGILTVGGAFVAILGVLFSLFMVSAFVTDKGQGFVDLTGLAVGLAFTAAGVVTFAAGRRRARIERESDQRGFEELATSLAAKNNGQVRLDDIAKASGLPSDEARGRMRALTGRGLFEMDFDQNGQMVFKLSADGGRAQLSDLGVRS
jgi:membrane protein implicated in regulation of membrane protease activity